MSDLIDALQDIDRSLIKSIDSSIEPVLLLEDVEIGSIRAWLSQRLKTVSDEGLGELEWKKVVGAYLVRGKYIFINFLDGKTEITDRDLEIIEGELVELAEETNIKRFPDYRPIPRKEIAQDIQKISTALAPLEKGDTAKYITANLEAGFNIELAITPEKIEELITSEVIPSETTMIVKVKKPDFLGESQWEFHYDGKVLSAKILDAQWLLNFQEGKIPLSPGDAVRASVKTDVLYGHDREVIATHHAITKVLEVIPNPTYRQPTLPGSGITKSRRAMRFEDI